jgi:hypothetical protein
MLPGSTDIKGMARMVDGSCRRLKFGTMSGSLTCQEQVLDISSSNWNRLVWRHPSHPDFYSTWERQLCPSLVSDLMRELQQLPTGATVPITVLEYLLEWHNYEQVLGDLLSFLIRHPQLARLESSPFTGLAQVGLAI